MGAPLNVAPAVPMKVVLHFVPVAMALPDPDKNVLLGLADGTSLEGWLEGTCADNMPVWRDVTAMQLATSDVVSWALLPEGLNDPDRQALLLQADIPAHQVRVALQEALEQLQGWVAWKCPKRHQAEHLAAIDRLAKAGGCRVDR